MPAPTSLMRQIFALFVPAQKCLLACCILFFSIGAVAQPVITGVLPASGNTGSSFVIQGSGFSNTALANIVKVNGISVVPSAASSTALTVAVPLGTCPGLPVTVSVNGLTASAALPFNVTFPGGGPFTAGSFAADNDLNGGAYTYDIVSADMDGDGKPDLLTINKTDKNFTVYKNTSTATTIAFGSRTDVSLQRDPNSIALGDFDGDGKADVAVEGSYFGFDSVTIYRNTTNGGVISFQRIASFSSLQAYGLKIGDLDGDGRPDIVATASNGVYIYKNKTMPGAIDFEQASYVNIAPDPQDVTLADVNGDGKTDIITCNGNNTVAILPNNSSVGNISFNAPVSFVFGNALASVGVANIDNDGKPEIIAVNQAQGKVYVAKNNGTGGTVSFTTPIELVANYNPWGLSLADMDGDGKTDIVTANGEFSPQIILFRNISTNTPAFEDGARYYTDSKAWKVTVADFRNTGSPDIATIKQAVNKIGFLKNTITDPPVISSFTPTSAGQGFVVTINGTHLAAATAVSFGGVAATNLTIVSDSKITAMVATGASGNVVVTTPSGNATSAGFTYTTPPGITAVQPWSGRLGDMVKITGNGFEPTLSGNVVYFGAAKAVVTSATANAIYVTVPAGATHKPITVSARGYVATSPRSFNLWFPDGTLTDTTFARRFESPESWPANMYDLTTSDLDGDGLTDVVLALHGSTLNNYPLMDSVGIYRNTSVNGKISFANRIRFKSSGSFTAVVTVSDVDGDGKPDIIACNKSFTENYTAIDVFRNTSTPGNISFATPYTILNFTALSITHAAIGDLDGDGKPDIAFVDGSEKVFLYKNACFGTTITFSPGPVIQGLGEALSLCIIDINGDRKPDIVTPSLQNNTVSIFINTGTPGNIGFAAPAAYNSGVKSTYIAAADLDGDDKNDLIIGAGSYSNVSTSQDLDTAIVIARNTGTGGNISFENVQQYPLYYPDVISTADLNGDNKADIYVSNVLNFFSLLQNNSTPGTIAIAAPKKTSLASSIRIFGIAAGDLDGDGKPDIALSDNYGQKFTVLINQNPSDAALCPNGNTSLTTNLAGATYQWRINTGSGYASIINNANFSGATTSVLSLSNVPSSWTGYKIRCVVNAEPGREYTLRFENRWTGSAGTAWENPANWSCGIVPDSNTDVVINSGTVSVQSNQTVRSLTLAADVQFTVEQPWVFTVLQ